MKKKNCFKKEKPIILLKKAFENIILKIIQVILNQYKNFINCVNHDKAKI